MDLAGEKLLRIEYIPLGRVAKWDKNPKKHDLPRLMSSIKRYGFRDAVIFDGTLGALVAGHGRASALEALRNQGDPPPFGVATDDAGAWYLPVQFGNDAPSRAVAEAFALDHNNLTLSGSGLDSSLLWDTAAYADVLRTLSEGFELPETVGAEEAGRLLGLDGKPKDVEPQIDKAAELAVKWGTALGQVWELGAHRIGCIDSTNKEMVNRLVGGRKIDTVFTDIPYGIDYSGGRTQVVRHKPYGRIQGDKDSDVSRFVGPLFELGARDIWVCASPVNLGPALAPFDKIGGINAVVVWDKRRPGLGYQWIRRQCEFILFYTTRSKARDDDSEFDLWSISTDNTQEYLHGTQKPVDLIERALLFSESKSVIDLYFGSGSTLVACERIGAIFIGADIDPAFVAVTLQRWADLTGKSPNLLAEIV